MRYQVRQRIGAISILVLALTGTVWAGGISVTQGIDPAGIPYEGEATLEIKLEWVGSQTAYRFDKPLSPQFQKLRIGSFSSSISSAGAGAEQITIKTFRYVLSPTGSGVGRVDPIMIEYTAWPDSQPGLLVTEAMSIEIAAPVPKESGDGLGLFWIVGLGVMAAIGGWMVILLSRRRAVEPESTPVETFLAGLAVARSEAGSDMKKFQGAVFDLIGEYLHSSFGITFDGTNDEELKAALVKTRLRETQQDQLVAWLKKAQADKFMPVASSPGETVRLENEIREFFEQIT